MGDLVKTNTYIVLMRAVLGLPGYRLLLAGIWFAVITVFLWLPQVNLLSYIVTQAPLSPGEKIAFFSGYYSRVLTLVTNPIVLSMLVFSVLTALSIVLLVFMLRTVRRLQSGSTAYGKAYAATAGSVVGSHVLSCGGTLLLAQIFPAFSGSSAVLGGSGATINMWLAVSANLVGIAIVIYTIRKISADIIGLISKQPAPVKTGIYT